MASGGPARCYGRCLPPCSPRGGQVSAYIMIGASSPGPHHSVTFDLAEDAIAIGIDTLEALIRST